MDDSDDQLGLRLDSALQHLDTDQVDVARLLHGSRRRARQVRTRRIAAVATAAVLVVGVPVGYEAINPQPGGTAPPAVLLPSDAHPAGSRAAVATAQPGPTAAASPGPPSTGVPTAGSTGVPTAVPTAVPTDADVTRRTSIPDAFGLSAAELPAGLVYDWTAVYGSPALVNGMQCQPAGSSAARPVAGRQWWWRSAGSADLAVSLTVTRWPAGAAAAGAVRGLGTAAGPCRWDQAQTTRSLTLPRVEQTWAATSVAGGRHYARSVIRTGNGVVGIEVQGTGSAASVTEVADQLAVIEAGRLERTPLDRR